ncbi:MAG: xanthine dehydrogenase accessory protein XdhC [Burkholderiales bacterium RIFCSPLOWO2_12_FULL_61_40]|nr:MAG: xanthine dehydrogenase accessory protein XdhC [Burkholderiales bacterium RIFCSPLOWO2_12_FULL_61_40]
MTLTSRFLDLLAREDAVLVTVHSTRGSVPRETGAWMAVFAHTTVATVGGGRLELDAIGHARAGLVHGTLATGQGVETVRYALGPSLGQCCGGEVHLRYERVTARDAARLIPHLARAPVPVALFGGGHVGRAVIAVLGTLPMAVRWIDSRDEIFPDQVPAHVQCEHSDPVQAAVADLPAGSRVLIMSFSHAEDLDVVAACLARQRAHGDLPYVGLIGSQTKWASFRQRLQARGFSQAEMAHITCPIGVPGIADKRPEAIAVAVAAQLLQVSADQG